MDQKRRFKIKNLGVIQSGSFEVKPLTLFCGPNNSGKTWIMYSLYHFYSFMRDRVSIDMPKKVINAIQAQGTYEFSFIDWLKGNDKEIIGDCNRQVSKSLPELFNSSSAIFRAASFNLDIETNHWINTLQVSQEKNKVYRSKDRKKTVRLSKPAESEVVDVLCQGASKDLLEFGLEDFIKDCLFPDIYNTNIFLMPAERNGLHLFFRELSSRRTALLHHASKENIDILELLHDVMHSRYAIPIAKYIDWLNDLSEIKRAGRGEFHTFAEKLKRDLAHGVYKFDARTSDITFKPYQKKRDGKQTKSLGLHVTSSTVKSLFGLWFYLEYQAKPGNTLMIDEPELNIHPENQRKLARFFAALVNAGLNVVISTHSDYMVREFNSLIMLNQAGGDALMSKHNYEKNEVLAPDQVGAYLFDNQTIKDFEITSDDGIYATTFDEVIRDLNKVNDDIYYSLKEPENEQGSC